MSKWIGLALAFVILASPVIWQVARSADPQADAPKISADVTSGAGQANRTDAVTVEVLRAEVIALRQEVDQLRGRVDGLDTRTSIGLSAAGQTRAPLPQAPASGATRPEATPPQEGDSLQDSFDQVVLIGGRRDANAGLTVASPTFLRTTFGLPRQDLNQDCQSMTNPRLRDLLRTEDVGPIRVTMLAPAVASLRQVFAEVQAFEPELYDRLASSGSLCVRLIRGSTSSASAHAYGLAVDINVDGVLDNFADGKTQLGLILMADFFRAEGWIWGAGFSREDSMHFEVSREKIEEWVALGLL